MHGPIRFGLVVVAVAALGAVLCSNENEPASQQGLGSEKNGDQAPMTESPETLTVTGSAFEPDQPLPTLYTGDGKDRSSPLQSSGVPEQAKPLALICDEPDAPTPEPFVHWVIYAILAESEGLPEGVPARHSLKQPQGAKQGKNSFGKTGYGGPAPPKGHGAHHYHFKLYALDVPPELPAGASKRQLLDAMGGHILAKGELVGTYER